MNTAIHSRRFSVSGFSLIELMIAMAISLILLLGVTQIYLGTSATNRAQEGLSRVQENARFAIDSLSRDIRHAGYFGCPRTANAEPQRIMADRARANEEMFLADNYIFGVQNANNDSFWGNDKPDTDADGINVVDGMPAVRITYSSTSDAVPEDGSFDGANFDLQENPDRFTQGDLITITDCTRTEIAEISNVTESGGGASINIAHGGNVNSPHNDLDNDAFSDEARAMRTYQFVYFIGTNPSGETSLYRRDLAAAEENRSRELVEGVEEIRIQYGEDTSGNLQADTYRSAEAVNDWSTVMSVRIALLLASGDVLSEQRARDFNLLGETVNTGPDRRIRQVATTTVSLRNRQE